MQLTLLNSLMAFLEGFALILSPCILPILPILLSGGISGGRRRPLGIICGFVIVFAMFTFSSRFLVQQLNLNLDTVRYIAFAFIALFGVIMLSDYLSTKFSILTSRLGNFGFEWGKRSDNQTGFTGGLLLGAFTSLVWVPCGGPILATAIIESAIQNSKFESFMIFFFFALGSIIPMILIALLGRTIIDRFKFLKTKSGIIRKALGIRFCRKSL